MKVNESFEVAQPLESVWRVLQDIPTVVSCLPGATLGDALGGDRYRGLLAVKLGPIRSHFEGEASVVADGDHYRGHIAGDGVDKKGGSRGKMAVEYRLLPEGASTRVEVDADFTLSGRAAQFGRVGLIQELTRRMLGEFAANLEATLRSPEAS